MLVYLHCKSITNLKQETMATKATTSGNALLSLAAKTTKPKTAKKNNKEIIIVDDKAVSAAIDSLVKNKEINDTSKAAMDVAHGIIKPFASKIWTGDVQKTTKFKESFILSSKNSNSVLFTVTDAYKSTNLDPLRIKYLQENYGENIITVENKFVINSELIDKYGQLLVDFIKNSKKIDEADKTELIQLEQKYSITKGTVNELHKISVEAKTTVEAVFNDIEPTCALKIRGTKKD